MRPIPEHSRTRGDRRDRTPFTIFDAILLCTAVVIGGFAYTTDPESLESRLGLPLSGNPQVRDQIAKRLAALDRLPPSLSLWRTKVTFFLDSALPFATLGALLATFRHRSAFSRRSLRHIGVLTTAVAGTFVGVCLANEYVLRRFPVFEAGYQNNPFALVFWSLGDDTCLGVVALWCVLAIARRWRASPDWPDRLGRMIGAAWILRAILGVLLKYVLSIS